MSLAIVQGYLELSFRLNGEESFITNQHRVDDGQRRVAIIKRNGTQASLEIDGVITVGETRPTDKKEAYLPGHIFIGGAPDLLSFTGNRFTTGFYGCIESIEPIAGGTIHFSAVAISGMNVDECP